LIVGYSTHNICGVLKVNVWDVVLPRSERNQIPHNKNNKNEKKSSRTKVAENYH
jgi:hypothetical protein